MQHSEDGRLELNHDPGESVVMSVLCLPIDANAAEGSASTVPVDVVPPPGPGGALPTRDGRREVVPDVARLADQLNRQPIAARVDTDHQSEPASPNYCGETAAGGWLSNFRVNPEGGITADMDLGAELMAKVRTKRYRYISPAYLVVRDGTVTGLSSIALVNNPNLPLDAPTLHSMAQSRLRAAEVVDKAILNGQVGARARDYCIDTILNWKGGVVQGVAAFEGMISTAFAAQTGRAAAARWLHHGYHAAPGPRMTLHAEIRETADSEGTPYREVMMRYAGSAGRAPTGVELHAMQAYERLKPGVDAALARIIQIPAEGLLARAKKCLEIAESLAGLGNWTAAVRAITEARETLKASDELIYDGNPARAQQRLPAPEPTPTDFVTPNRP